MSRGLLITLAVIVVVVVVVLAFGASFLGASLANRNAPVSEPAVVTITPTAEPTISADEAAVIAEVLPAGADVRAGTGTPSSTAGADGDVYIDISNANVYINRDGSWVLAGNIRTSAAENLAGADGSAGADGTDGTHGTPGATGAAGATGAPGATGAAGTPGTSVALGTGAPTPKTCTTDGDIYVDTLVPTFYDCTAGVWTSFGPAAE